MKILDRGVIFDASRQPAERRFCFFINSLALADGRILVTCRAGSSKDSADENILIFLSADQGQHWELVCEGLDGALDGVAGAWRAAHLAELRPGRLIGLFNWFDRSEPGRPLANPRTGGLLPSRLFVMESADAGRTWIERREVPKMGAEEFAITDPLVKLAGGTLGLSYEAWKSYYDTAPVEVPALLRISGDGGRTFGPPVVVAQDPAGVLYFWDARMSVDPASGEIISLFWTHDRHAGQDVNIHIAWGSPDGRRWSYPQDTGLAGQHPTPLALPGGRALMFYEHRHDPPSLRAVLSADSGKSWDWASELTLYESRAGVESGVGSQRTLDESFDDMLRYTFGHPWPSRLADGSVFVAFYAGDAGSMSLHWVRLAI
jgi:sialidase-1